MSVPAEPGLDARRRDVFAALTELEQRVLHRVDESAAETRREVLAETRQLIETSRAETRELVAAATIETRRDLDERMVDARRHFGVLAESLMTKLELVAEGVQQNTVGLERFQSEVRAQFAAVDRRLLRLEARRFRRRDR